MISALIGGMLIGYLVSSHIKDLPLALFIIFPIVLVWVRLCYLFNLP